MSIVSRRSLPVQVDNIPERRLTNGDKANAYAESVTKSQAQYQKKYVIVVSSQLGLIPDTLLATDWFIFAIAYYLKALVQHGLTPTKWGDAAVNEWVSDQRTKIKNLVSTMIRIDPEAFTHVSEANVKKAREARPILQTLRTTMEQIDYVARERGLDIRQNTSVFGLIAGQQAQIQILQTQYDEYSATVSAIRGPSDPVGRLVKCQAAYKRLSGNGSLIARQTRQEWEGQLNTTLSMTLKQFQISLKGAYASYIVRYEKIKTDMAQEQPGSDAFKILQVQKHNLASKVKQAHEAFYVQLREEGFINQYSYNDGEKLYDFSREYQAIGEKLETVTTRIDAHVQKERIADRTKQVTGLLEQLKAKEASLQESQQFFEVKKREVEVMLEEDEHVQEKAKAFRADIETLAKNLNYPYEPEMPFAELVTYLDGLQKRIEAYVEASQARAQKVQAGIDAQVQKMKGEVMQFQQSVGNKQAIIEQERDAWVRGMAAAYTVKRASIEQKILSKPEAKEMAALNKQLEQLKAREAIYAKAAGFKQAGKLINDCLEKDFTELLAGTYATECFEAFVKAVGEALPVELRGSYTKQIDAHRKEMAAVLQEQEKAKSASAKSSILQSMKDDVAEVAGVFASGWSTLASWGAQALPTSVKASIQADLEDVRDSIASAVRRSSAEEIAQNRLFANMWNARAGHEQRLVDSVSKLDDVTKQVSAYEKSEAQKAVTSSENHAAKLKRYQDKIAAAKQRFSPLQADLERVKIIQPLHVEAFYAHKQLEVFVDGCINKVAAFQKTVSTQITANIQDVEFDLSIKKVESQLQEFEKLLQSKNM
ncbi:MAG: hypothetical protein H0X51_02015 [Parachlamydiaceae bacterium]|nr:hypothetical protein [Parachlamydiaceae bacterium]